LEYPTVRWAKIWDFAKHMYTQIARVRDIRMGDN